MRYVMTAGLTIGALFGLLAVFDPSSPMLHLGTSVYTYRDTTGSPR